MCESCSQCDSLPLQAVDAAVDIAAAPGVAAAETAVGAAVKKTTPWAPKWSKSQKRPYWVNTEDGSTAWEEPLSEGAAARGGLLDGWYECTSGDGRAYYHHPATMENRWDKPVKLPGAEEVPASSSAAAQQHAPAPATAATAVARDAATTGAPDATLPEGWTVHGLDKQGSKPYYYHTTSKTTSWIHPKHTNALPDGWAAVAMDDGSGKVYFHNTVTGVTSWTKPVA